ncbi:hypothetical protein D9758_017038 [Tetrapyrgos nigripes]|uniref:HAT C-terminal dimerisation domain-containing protein n=1 Tax=Tetrapyrgos nigripes TaxID=182062 RepID=A0A8H5CL08_9AGAR|nr:hypothetical protein D9758_017038 [Tetrapyrgos nigripes]
MLILDVRTRWSSTHQMLRRALDYRKAIDTYVSTTKELRPYELDDTDWKAIETVSDWLKQFRLATTEMSATGKVPMVSNVHGIFRRLQRHLKNILQDLPEDTSPEIKQGLTNAHRKLSDYYFKFDASPFYIWASLLDPRISYFGLKDEFDEERKSDLYMYFDNHYVKQNPKTSAPPQASLSSAPSVDEASFLGSGSLQKSSFRTMFRKPVVHKNELDTYFSLPIEHENTNPVAWWYQHRKSFPNLYCLTRDIMSIPGSAVAVERIFSSGRDTISIRRSRLHADTIRVLMVVKHHLHLKRNTVEEIIADDE